MTLLLADTSAAALIDWPSLGWTALLGVLTFTCLTVRARFRQIAAAGKAAEILGHVVVGYFSLGMAFFGSLAAFTATFPVPGGVAWEGPVAVIGGLAALTIGGTTLYEHVVTVLAMRHETFPGLTLVSAGGRED